MTGNAIEGLRTQIEAVDAEILARVAERTELARRIGAAKRSRSSGPLDPAREAAVIRRAVRQARQLGLPEEPVRDLFWTIVELCRKTQQEDT